MMNKDLFHEIEFTFIGTLLLPSGSFESIVSPETTSSFKQVILSRKLVKVWLPNNNKSCVCDILNLRGRKRIEISYVTLLNSPYDWFVPE